MTKNADLTRSLGTDPLTVETLPSALRCDPTPLDAVYIRNNRGAVDGQGPWTIEIAGTTRPGILALSEIFGPLPGVELTAVLQCAGNGRRRLPETAPGVQWDLGGMACVDWSGVRVADVVAACGGPAGDPTFLTTLGGDGTADDPARVERSVPLAAAMADAIVADRLNGEPIPDIHGGPVRLVMPGYYAVNSVKWVRRLALTDTETDASIQAVRYRMVPPGEEPSPLHPSVWAMKPVAMILEAAPLDEGWAVSGVAFGDGGAIESVDLSVDGSTWVPVELGPARGRFGWRRFRGVVGKRDGVPWVAARCATGEGVQPRHTAPSVDGYAVNGWEDLAHRLQA